MPQLGEIKKGREMGYCKNKNSKYIWHACVDCGEERWVRFLNIKVGGHPQYLHCSSCAHKGLITGSRHPNWKGGRMKSEGYIKIWLPPDDFFYSMVGKDGYVLEHRLVAAKSLGRNLHSWEIVHHKNHIRDDNRMENLQLVSDDRHKQITILEIKINRLETRVTLLEAENILLRDTAQQVVE